MQRVGNADATWILEDCPAPLYTIPTLLLPYKNSNVCYLQFFIQLETLELRGHVTELPCLQGYP